MLSFLQRDWNDDRNEQSDCGNARGLPWFLAILFFCLTGCAAMPDTVHVAAVHMSQPMRGMGPQPIGGDNPYETTYEAIELGARWNDGHMFAESTLGYSWHQTQWVGEPWLFNVKAGVQWGLRK